MSIEVYRTDDLGNRIYDTKYGINYPEWIYVTEPKFIRYVYRDYGNMAERLSNPILLQLRDLELISTSPDGWRDTCLMGRSRLTTVIRLFKHEE